MSSIELGKALSSRSRLEILELLSEILLAALLEVIGTDRARGVLKKIGRSLGEKLATQITEQNKVTHWNIEALKKYVVEGHFSELGAFTSSETQFIPVAR
jgi:predicted hydrocarbon binding protein